MNQQLITNGHLFSLNAYLLGTYYVQNCILLYRMGVPAKIKESISTTLRVHN